MRYRPRSCTLRRTKLELQSVFVESKALNWTKSSQSSPFSEINSSSSILILPRLSFSISTTASSFDNGSGNGTASPSLKRPLGFPSRVLSVASKVLLPMNTASFPPRDPRTRKTPQYRDFVGTLEQTSSTGDQAEFNTQPSTTPVAEMQRSKQGYLTEFNEDQESAVGDDHQEQNAERNSDNDDSLEQEAATSGRYQSPGFIQTASQALRGRFGSWPFSQVSAVEKYEQVKYPSLTRSVEMPGGFPGSPMSIEPSEVGDTASGSPSMSERSKDTIVGRVENRSESRGRGTTLSSSVSSPSHRNRMSSPTPSMSARAVRHQHRSSRPPTPTPGHFNGRLDQIVNSHAHQAPDSDEEFFTVQREMITSPGHRYPPLMHRSHNTPSKDSVSDMGLDDTLHRRTPKGFKASPALPPKPSEETAEEGEEMEGAITQPSSPVESYNPFLPQPLRSSVSPSTSNPFHSAYVTYNLSSGLAIRNPHVLAHAASHQGLLDQLPFGTLFQLAMTAQKLGVDLDDISSDELKRLLGKNDRMKIVANVLKSAKVGRASSIDLLEEDLPRNASLDEVAKELDWEAEKIIEGKGEMLGWKQETNTPYGGKIQFALGLRLDEPQVLQSRPKSGSSRSAVRPASGPFDLEKHGVFEFQPPCTRGSSIFARVFGSHRFLRVKLGKRILNETTVWNTTGERRRNGREQLRKWLKRPLFIYGRVFVPILEKDGTIFYFLEGNDRIGGEFERVLNGRLDYGITEIRTVKELLEWWVPLEHNQRQGMAKLVTRLELGFSDTLPGVLIPPENVHRSDDITRYVNNEKVIFTDGAGLMTPSVAYALAQKYFRKDGDRPREVPLAFQVRIQTAKGVLLVDPVMLTNGEINGPFRIKLYESMIKANQGRPPKRSGPVEGLHILDAACCILNIVKPAPVSSADGSRLSAQFITILSDCGVPNELFLGLQEKSLRKELEAWTSITFIGTQEKFTLDQSTRTNLASMISKSQNFALSLKQRELGGAARGLGYKKYNKKENWEDSDEEGADDEEESLDPMKAFESFTTTTTTGTMDINSATPAFSHNPISGWPMTKARALHDALLAGVEVHKSVYWVKIWHEVAKAAMQRIVAKFHFTVERSASGFFQPDPTGLLNEGEVFFRPKGVMTDSETGLRIQSVTGEVIIGRHPALLPTDMRKVSAVNIPLLEDFQGIIFCSVKGEIPLAALCAGGDYDGDEATIIWEPSIVQVFANAPLHFREPPDNFNNNFDKVTTEVSVVHRELGHLPEPEYSTRIAEHLLGSVGDADSFNIYNAFWNMAVCKHGLRGTPDGKNPGTDMAHKFNALMDGKKAGIRIKDEVLQADKKVWTLYNDPIWRQRQKSKDASESVPFSDGKKEVPYLNGETPVLDRLVFDGDRQLGLAMADMTNRLEETRSKAGQSGMDEDLAALWITMKQRTGPDMELRREVDAIEQVVRMSYNRLLKINSDTARNANGLRLYSPNIRQLCRDYRMHPSVEEVPSFVARCEPATDHEFLEKVKASCAYVVEMENGKEKGFPWIVAMRELCAMKAKAVKEWEDPSERDIATLPRAIYDRLEVHRYWRSA